MTVKTPETSDKSQTPDPKELSNTPVSQNTETAPVVSSNATGTTTPAPTPVVVQPRHPMPLHFPELRHHEPKVVPAPVAVTEPLPAPKPPEDPHSIHDASRGYQPERDVCVRCGSTNLAKGYVVDYSEKFRTIHFAPRRMTLRRLNSLISLLPFRSLAKLDAVACRDCGAVLLVVEPSELRRAEHRRENQ